MKSTLNQLASISLLLMAGVFSNNCQQADRKASSDDSETRELEREMSVATDSDQRERIEYPVTVTLTNTDQEAVMQALQENDSSVTREAISAHVQRRLLDALNEARLSKGHAATATFSLSVGMDGEMEVDPAGNLIKIGGTIEIKSPKTEAIVIVMEGDREVMKSRFTGGVFGAERNLEGVMRTLDMAIGHFLKDLARVGISTDRIVAVLAKDKWLPESPYVHLEVNIGKIMIHQEGNRWQALCEIGERAVPALKVASESDDQEVAKEALSCLEKLK